MVTKSDAIFLSETWLCTDDTGEDLQITGFKLKLNSVGPGRGLATYFKADKFHHSGDVKDAKFQLTKISSKTLDIISMYRSADSKLDTIEENLLNLIDVEKTTIICGDFNICFKSERNNRLIKTIEDQGFQQLNKEATHFAAGHIDHIYVNGQAHADVSLYSPYYCAKDHDALLEISVSILNI